MFSQSLKQVIQSPEIQKRFSDMLGENAGSFLSTILTVVNSNNRLKKCTIQSVLSASATAAALKLPITPSLGLAHIIPFKSGDVYLAQFQLGWKGYVQLAMRSGQYRRLNAAAVPEGIVKEVDPITGDIIRGKKISDKIVGYVAYFELLNGFNKTLFMSIDDLKNHAAKYSRTYSYDLKNDRKTSVWTTNFDSMAKKTVLKLLLGRFGIISIDARSTDMAIALKADQAVINQDGTYSYVDNDNDNSKLIAFSEVIGEIPAPEEEFNSDSDVEAVETEFESVSVEGDNASNNEVDNY